MVNHMKIRYIYFFVALSLKSITPSVNADEVKFFDDVPSVDELSHQLLGVSIGSNSPPSKVRRSRSFQVDGDTAQQASDSVTEDHPNLVLTRIAIQDKSDPQPGQAALVVANKRAPALAFPINFNISSSQLQPESLKYLDAIAEMMKKNNTSLLIEGHTDASGNADVNYKLSRDRAYSVINYLVERHNIYPARLSGMGVGSKEILEGVSPTNPKNRRVQIRVRPS